MKVLLCLIILELTFPSVQHRRLGLEGGQIPLGNCPFAWRLFLGPGNRQLDRGSCLMAWHMLLGLGNYFVCNTSEPFYDPLGYFEAGPLYLFPVRLQPFSFDLPIYDEVILYDCPLLDCQLPWFDSLFFNHVAGCPLGQLQLLGLSITLVWFLSYCMKVILCLNIPVLSPFWSGVSSLGSKIVLYFQILLSPSLPVRVTLRRGMERKIEFYCQLFRPLRCFNMAPLRLCWDQ